MLKVPEFQPSRTFALSAVGTLVLSVVLIVLVSMVGVALYTESPDLGHLLTAVEVAIGAVAATSAGGAGAMAVRDYGSKGLTSSQGAAVTAGRLASRTPPPTLGGRE